MKEEIVFPPSVLTMISPLESKCLAQTQISVLSESKGNNRSLLLSKNTVVAAVEKMKQMLNTGTIFFVL